LKVELNAAKKVKQLMWLFNAQRQGSSLAPENTMELISMNLCSGGFKTFGVEYIAPGKNARSPKIYYVNTGDLYNTTLYWRGDTGTFRVGAVADVIERGNYS
jgi:hypothetical protein